VPDVDQRLVFLSWVRERIAGLATGVEQGRARGETGVTLTGTRPGGAVTTSQTRTLRFLLAGPGDVVGLVPAAITRRYPAPGTVDHESDRCAHVELAEASLPWRYTPAPKPPAGTGALHPWLVLVVGVEHEQLELSADQVTLGREVQAAHPVGLPAQAHPWAHVQVDAEGRRVARVLSGRALEPGTDYVAVLVPAFDRAGAPHWNGTQPVTVPLYDHWRFRTATPAGSFEDLAARLRPGEAPEKTGRAPLDYPRVPAAGDLELRGALAPLGTGDTELPPEVAADVQALHTPAVDDRGRPIVGLPNYGEAWRLDAPEATAWGVTLRTDPRDRGVAGLGLELGIRLQEELAAEAAANLGALAEARQRIRDLVLGLASSRRLWDQRLPPDPVDKLWVLGPALRRVVTDAGPVADLATAEDRALPRGLFSTAARRVLRPGPARTRQLRKGGVTPGEVLQAANRCPAPPAPSEDGVPLRDLGIDDFEERRRKALETGEVDREGAAERAKELADRAHPNLRGLALLLAERLAEAAGQRSPAPWAEALALLAAAAAVADEDTQEVERLHRELVELVERFPKPAGPTDETDLLDDLGEPDPVEPPCRPVDVDALADGVTAAFDPTGDDAPVVVRVLDTIDGLDPAQPLAPPEVCLSLDRPVWADVGSAFPEWLLPGVGALPQDSVIAVETNPRFVDAILTGFNTQLLNELRWRNLPVATGCTPLRVFWDRAEVAAGARVDDIVGIHAWPEGSGLGDAQHRPAGASGRDLVVVIRGQLFLRYPATLVYLVSAEHGGTPDFDSDPAADAARLLPSFQGRIAADVSFFGFQGFQPAAIRRHWLVFEEPPAGYRFANDVSVAPQAHIWASEAFARPVRALIRGDRLDPEGQT
jgi:hypothetical protein